jgi:hypothetical protein
MKPTQQDLAATYRSLSDKDLASLCADIGSLTEEARTTLQSEMKLRKIGSAQLEKMHTSELRREAHFDRGESIRRKRTAMWLFFRNDPRWTVGAVIAFLILVAISELIAHFHLAHFHR